MFSEGRGAPMLNAAIVRREELPLRYGGGAPMWTGS